MTAEEDITSTMVVKGGPIGGASANHGAGLVWGVYEIAVTEANDWIIIPEFEEILFVSAAILATGKFTAEPVTVDGNKITFADSTSETLRLFVAGTPSVEAD